MTTEGVRPPDSTDPLARWKLIGVTATAVVVLLIPLSLVVNPGPGAHADSEEIGPSFVGRERCAACHEAATRAWLGSDHDLAMAEATEETVLGDFNDVEVEYHGITSRFFRRDGAFVVRTEARVARWAISKSPTPLATTRCSSISCPIPVGGCSV